MTAEDARSGLTHVVPPDPDERVEGRRRVNASEVEVSTARTVLLESFAEYVWLKSYDPLLFGAAVVLTGHMGGDPTWGQFVSPPSTAKTEVIRAFDSVVDEKIDELSVPGLLGWTRSKPARPVGILSRNPGRCTATIADFSTLLASSDRGLRDQLYALLRRAYDGHVSRDIAPGRLSWEGRLTLLAAVTPSIDNYSSHANALGPRWVYYRIDPLAREERRSATTLARQMEGSINQHRRVAQEAAKQLCGLAAERIPTDLPDAIGDAIDDAAIIAALGRAAIERSGYGRREILSLPTVEGPSRLAGQLTRLGRALLALGLDDDDTTALCRRAALDNIPQARRVVLTCLASGEPQTASRIARCAGCDRKVARFALEELQAIGLVSYEGADEEADDDAPSRTQKPWILAGEDAKLATALLTAGGGTKCGVPIRDPLHTPPEKRAAGSNPTLRPTFPPNGPATS